MRLISRWVRLSFPDKLLVLNILVLLVIAKLSIKLFPLKKIAPFLGTHHHESTEKESLQIQQKALRIGRLINSVARRLPWASKCYDKAIVSKTLLSYFKISATVYLGVANKLEGENGIEAHAWVRCGEVFVVGGEEHLRFTTVSTFS